MICVQIRCLMFLWLIIRSVLYLSSTWFWSVALTPKEFIAEEAFLLLNSRSVETVVHFHGLSMTRKYEVCSRLWILCPFLPKEMRWWKELVFMQAVRKNSSPDIEFQVTFSGISELILFSVFAVIKKPFLWPQFCCLLFERRGVFTPVLERLCEPPEILITFKPAPGELDGHICHQTAVHTHTHASPGRTYWLGATAMSGRQECESFPCLPSSPSAFYFT